MDPFDAFYTSIVGGSRGVHDWDPADAINLSSIVNQTQATALIDKMGVDLAKIRLYYAKRYSVLLGAFNLVFKKLDMSTATVGERVAKCIFDDVLAKRIHKRPRSYGWYVVKQYFMPIWRLRNWLWKTTIAKKYAPGGVGFLQDRDDAEMFIDLGANEILYTNCRRTVWSTTSWTLSSTEYLASAIANAASFMVSPKGARFHRL